MCHSTKMRACFDECARTERPCVPYYSLYRHSRQQSSDEQARRNGPEGHVSYEISPNEARQADLLSKEDFCRQGCGCHERGAKCLEEDDVGTIQESGNGTRRCKHNGP